MTQAQNQFQQSAEKGMMDLRFNSNIISCQVDATSAGGLIPGQPVKLVDSVGGVPKIVECAADSDDVFGFIVFDIKSKQYNVGDKVEIAAFHDCVMYMEASAAIVRGEKVEIVLAGVKVATAASGKMIVGRALDKATAAGQLIRVVTNLPGTLAP